MSIITIPEITSKTTLDVYLIFKTGQIKDFLFYCLQLFLYLQTQMLLLYRTKHIIDMIVRNKWLFLNINWSISSEKISASRCSIVKEMYLFSCSTVKNMTSHIFIFIKCTFINCVMKNIFTIHFPGL